MSIDQIFSAWRSVRPSHSSWGLAWYLANEFCKRYYASHGIAPFVISHEGLGYYGILLKEVACGVNDESASDFGRMTIAGDVENWRLKGDDRLYTSTLCGNGEPTENLVAGAIKHMALPAKPAKSHFNCRHKRWGASWQLCFEVAACLALKYGPHELEIWNHPIHVERLIRESDPQWAMKQHPGAFLFRSDERHILVAGDGRVLDGSNRNIWDLYMNGVGVSQLVATIEAEIRG
ncbi:MAG: hypothetical protein CALGDGBN_00290 [Pseudomonadales bacterium]|nr:hypothetical protein [Pseudomonadales bacterium]